MPEGWEWDETLFEGSAPFYAQGRLAYAADLAERLAEALGLDGQGRLLDVGCGPGSLTLVLAGLFREAVGLDPDAGMVAEAARHAQELGIANIRWVRAMAEELPLDLGNFRVVTFGQSFHWMDRDHVAATVREMLEPGGAFVLIADLKDPLPELPADAPYPVPPFAEIRALVERELGTVRRAGQGVLAHGSPGGEGVVLANAGFGDMERLVLPVPKPIVRTADDIVAWVFSLSYSAPHLFGSRRNAFETELRDVLHATSPEDRFSEAPPDTEVRIWRRA